MRYPIVSFLLIVLMVGLSLPLWTGCSSEPTDPEQPGRPATEADSSAVVDAAPEDCPDELDVICEDGLAFVPLGGFVAEVQASDLAATEIQDSVETGNGYEWLTRTLYFDQGQVIVEGDFIDQRQSNDTLLSDSRINRVRVESPLFRTARDIRVGQPVSRLLRAYPEGEFQVVPIPDYHAYQVRMANSHIFYLISAAGHTASDLSAAELTPRMLPQDAPIVAIVVM